MGLAARGAEEIEAVADEVEALGRRALAVPTDVTQEADVERLVEGVVNRLGGLHVPVNNSGVSTARPWWRRIWRIGSGWAPSCFTETAECS